MLGLAGDRFDMPEPAMDRLLRRRERRERNERIAATVLGLGVAVAGVAGAVVTLRVAGGTTPASEGGAAAAAEGGGFVLPTVAIWTAIVVLGLTVLAAVRLRARGEHVDVGQEGRGPGGAAAPARRPAAVPATAPRKGGVEMDSKPKTDVGIPRTEMPTIRFDEGRLRRTNRWLVAGVVLLAAAVVALGALLIAQAGDETTPVTERTTALTVEVPAPNEVVEAVDASASALNAGDSAALAATLAEDAVVTDTVAGREFEGTEAIVARYTGPLYEGFALERRGEVIQIGDLAAHAFTYRPSTMMDSGGSGFVVFQLDEDLKIEHQWIMGY